MPTDRRRAPRRRLNPAIHVRLIESGSGVDYEAVVLNASLIGMACRIHEANLADRVVGRTLRVVFPADSGDDGFELSARATNAIRSSRAGHWVVGMEFVPDQREMDQARLERLLSAGSGREVQVS